MALLYQFQGRYGEAEPLYKEALQVREKVLGKEHPDTLTSMNNLAALYESQGRYGEAEPLLKEALQVLGEVLGEEHPYTLSSMNNLALLYQFQGRYGEAEPLYKETLQIGEKALGKTHPKTLSFQLNYIGLMAHLKKDPSAFRLLKGMEVLLFSYSFQELYSTSDERVRRLFLITISNFQGVALSFAKKFPKDEYARYAANVILKWKQVYAGESAFQRRLLGMGNDPLEQRMASLEKEFTRQAYHPKPDDNFAETQKKLNAARKEMRKKAGKIKSKIEASTAHLDQIMGHLPGKSGLIEFRQYQQADFKTGKLTKRRFAAYLLLSDIEAEKQIYFADIGDAEEIKKIFENPKDRAKKMYGRLFGAFGGPLKKVEKLYIAPDGFLSLIPFASLIMPNGKYMVERFQINRLLTGRDLLDSPPEKPDSRLIAMGGIDYGTFESNNPALKTEAARLNRRAANELKEGMAPLPNSWREAYLIRKLYELNRKDGKAFFYTDDQATEHVLATMTEPPEILHLSTHGFYLENPRSATESEWLSEEPLLFSGLALAGANRGLNGKVDKNGDDGMLYSLEALSLNLRGTQLVSLSACDTGKGAVDYSEGVYGLVRAFRTAGARSVLMTLSPVNDESAKDFMVEFYDTWLSSTPPITPGEALHKTRLHFIHHPTRRKYRDPNVWSPYVIVGR